MPDSVLNSDPGSLPRVTPTPTSAYVREAKPGEISALAEVYARAFARDPMMNWLGGVRALVPADHHKAKAEGVDASVRRTLAGLRHFQLVLIKMARILGLVVVVVEKDSSEGEGEGERIVGGALWLKPGASLDPSPRTFVRISPWRVIWSWGLGALKVSVCVDVFTLCVGGMHHPPETPRSPPHSSLVGLTPSLVLTDVGVDVSPCRGRCLITRQRARRWPTVCSLRAG